MASPRGRPREDPGPSCDGPDLAHLLFLAAAVLLLAALYLAPATGFAYFGSDTGEYYRLTADLAGTGHLPVGGGYPGWGVGYPDFPGMFVVAAAASGASGFDPLSALMASVPLLAAFSVAPLFLLFRRIVPNDSVALLGAAFAGVFMPRAFSLAHPAPLALGDLFVVAALWMWVEGRRDPRWYAPLAAVGGALVVTHHLSSYFLLVIALGGLVVLELLRPHAWSRRFPTRELAFLAALGVGIDLFWFVAAPDFVGDVIAPSLPRGVSSTDAGLLLGVAAVLLPLAAGLLIRYRRAHPRRALRPAFPSDASVARDALAVAVGTFGGIALLLVAPLPGSTQSTTAATILFFVPLLLCIPLVAGTRRLSSVPRLGPLVLALLVAVGLSAAVGLVTGSSVILPVRHAEYLLIPLALLVALALGRWAGRAHDAAGARGSVAVAAAALLLLAANAALAYPPPSDLGGFQEGITTRDALLVEWSAGGLPAGAVVASDHRLSSYLFGADGYAATWGSTPALFVGASPAAAQAELNGVSAPTHPLPVDVVAVDGVMRTTGVALDPSALATPISPQASGWLAGHGFVPIYENEDETVLLVDGSGLAAP